MFQGFNVSIFQCSNVRMFECSNVQMSNVKFQTSNIKWQMSNVNKVKLLSERISGVPLIIFYSRTHKTKGFFKLCRLDSFHVLTYFWGNLILYSFFFRLGTIWYEGKGLFTEEANSRGRKQFPYHSLSATTSIRLNLESPVDCTHTTLDTVLCTLCFAHCTLHTANHIAHCT